MSGFVQSVPVKFSIASGIPSPSKSSGRTSSNGFDYQSIVPSSFNDPQSSEFIVSQTVNSVTQNATSQDAYTVAKSLSDFLRLGNETFNFSLFHTPIPRSTGQDVTSYVLENGFGQCKDYNTAFVTMARIAGLPARFVTGYVGGEWNGAGYTVSTGDYSSWGEVKLSFNTGSGEIDMGWIPFDSCPRSENLTVLNQSIAPLTIDRDLSDTFDFSGQFVYADNSTPIGDYDLSAYLVPLSNTQAELVEEMFVADVITDQDGNFSFSGNLAVSLDPGVYTLLIKHNAFELIPSDVIIYQSWINLTDDSVIIHEFPQAIGSPVVGAGSTTTIQVKLNTKMHPKIIPLKEVLLAYS